MLVQSLVFGELVLLVLVIALGLVLLALARQIGVLHERLAPMGAMSGRGGPAVGERAPGIGIVATNGRAIDVGAPSRRPRLLLFVSSTCPLCKQLLPTAKSFVRDERLDVLFVGDGDDAEREIQAAGGPAVAFDFVDSSRLGLAFQVGKLPHAVLVDEAGIVRAQGLVNSREHLESLSTAHATGFATLQDWLRASAAARA